jgi:hypothetical protein
MSTWTTRRLVDLLRSLSHLYYRRKYGALARRMGRPGVVQDDRRGFIVLQIDGLSHEHLLQALRAGVMPWLERALADGRLALSPYRCGLPSTTPAVQAALLFGTRHDIPGFRWYEKERALSVVAKRPDQMQAVQARLRQGVEGILAGGSSYVNLFDGDADLAFFTLAAFHPQRFFESIRGMGLVLLFLLSPFRVLRVFGLSLVGCLEVLRWRLAALFRGRAFRPYDLLGPFLAAVVNALFTEVQTFGVALDIYRRVPAIYANYNTYDEVAHVLGPTHRLAFRVLRDVDRRLRQIDRMRARYRSREYDLYLLSDHGNSPSVPFSQKVGRSLGQFIVEQLGQGASLDEVFALEGGSLNKARFLLDEMRAVTGRLPAKVARVVNALWRAMDRRLPADVETGGYDLERREDVVVRVSGSLAHVYFNVARRPLQLIEVALLYPALLDRLLETDGIGLVAGRAGGRVVVLGPGGGMAVLSDGRVEVEPPHPLLPFGQPDGVAEDLRRVVPFPHAGDLILLGAVADGRVVTFEDQVASHGGLGGPQEVPFIAGPADVALASFENPEDIHAFFRARYGR